MIFNFSSRYQSAFGFSTKNISDRLNEKGFGEVVKDDSGLNVTVYSNDPSTTFDEVTLRRDEVGKNHNYIFGYSPLTSEVDNVFATPPMMSLRKAKKLVITSIDNSDVEVVERFGTEPWEITWRGLLIDMNNHNFPLDKLSEINKIFEFDGIWNVDSEILHSVGIHSICIKDIAVDFVEGFEDTIAYSFTMRQIKPIEYQIIN